MQRIIKNGQVIDETWHLLPKETSFDELTNCDDYIVPLQMWRDHAAFGQRGQGRVVKLSRLQRA